MRKSIPALAAAAVAVAITVTSVASAAPRATDPGLKVFTSAGCAACHTLAAAKAKGMVGPNLDQLKPSAARVAAQVKKGGGGMPSFKSSLSAAQIKAVATFVATNAGRKK